MYNPEFVQENETYKLLWDLIPITIPVGEIFNKNENLKIRVLDIFD